MYLLTRAARSQRHLTSQEAAASSSSCSGSGSGSVLCSFLPVPVGKAKPKSNYIYAQNPSSSSDWSSIGIPSGKLNFVRGWWYLTIASSYAMAAFLALVKVPSCLFLPSMLILAWNFFPALDTPLKPVLLCDLIIFLFLILGISFLTWIMSGKFRSDFGRFAWMAARSNAMAASFVVPK